MLMRFSKLLVLSALLATTVSSARADIVNGVRQRPAVSSFIADYQIGDTAYLYNVAARQFFVGANDYNTRASVSTKGYRVAFVDGGDAIQYEGTLEFRDSVETRKAWLSVFATSDGGAVWVDNETEAFRFWYLTKGDNGYRISNPVLEDRFLGWAGADADTRLNLLTAEAVGLDWQFVTAEAYNAYQETWAAMEAQFNKAAELKPYLDQAKELGVDVAAEEAVYLNEAATVEELEAAILSLQAKINNAIAGDASVENPSDMTASLLNPNFDGASYEGWKGTAPNMAGNGQHALADVAEHYNKTFDTYQELNNMPAGVYMLTNTGFLRGWWDDAVNHTNYTAYLYAIADNDTMQVAMANPWEIKNTEPMAGATYFGTTASESSEEHDAVTYYAPNDPSAARLYFEKGYYLNTVFFAAEGGKMKLGVKKDKNRDSEWATFDSFKLTYYGNAAAAFQYWVNQTPRTDYSEAIVSEQYVEAYNATFNAQASNKAEAVAAMNLIKAASDSIALNVKLWKEFEAALKEGVLVNLNPSIPSAFKNTLADYIEFDLEDILAKEDDGTIVELKVDYSNDEVRAEIAKLKGMVDDAKSGVEPGTDVTTTYLTNATLDNGSTGWTIGKGNVAFREKIAEAYGTDFDLYQQVAKVPVGVYELQVQGFFRMERDQTAFDKYEAGEQKTDAGVYLNENKTSLKCVFEEKLINGSEAESAKTGGWWADPNTDYYPNDMTSAAYAFGLGMYQNSAFGLVAKSGDPLRMGVKGNVTGANWICFDNFKLIYRGFAPDVVKPVLEDKIKEMKEAYGEGTVMTKSAKAHFDAAMQNAEVMMALEAQTSEDSLNIFGALGELVKVANEVDEAIALCEEFSNLLDNLDNAAALSENQEALLEYAQKGEDLRGRLINCDLEADEIATETELIKALMTKLRLPMNVNGANDNGPVDVTAVINTPNFDDGTPDAPGANSVFGWVAEGYNFGNDDTQKGAKALEYYNKTFDIYQDIVGLPEGIYEVAVNAFCRIGSIDNDYEKFQEDPLATEAYLYAVGTENSEPATWQTPVACLFKGALQTDEAPGIGGELATTQGGMTYYVPNDMVSAAGYFEMDSTQYVNSVIARVGQDGKLRIGMKKETNTDSGWVLLDTWRLTYFGADSQLIPGSFGPSEIQNVLAAEPVRVEFFTIDGRRVSAAQKGITIQKTTLANGVVTIKKIARK